MAFIAVVISLSTTPIAHALDASAPAAKPSKAELENELSGYYQNSILQILKAMDPSREYAALVQVKFAPNAEWDKIPDATAGYEYLPGTIREKSETIHERRRALLSALPQKKNVMVTVPSDAEKSIEKPATDWIRRELGMASGEAVDFQIQSQPRKDPETGKPIVEKEKDVQTFHDAAKAAEAEKEKEESPLPFLYSKYFWIAIIIAGTFLGGLVLLMLGRSFARSGKPNPITTIMKKMNGEDEEKKKGSAKKADPAAVAAAEEELPPTIVAELNAIERVCMHDLEIASLAFAALAARTEDLASAAGITQGFGIDKALELFPKAGGAVWVKIGDAISEHSDPLTLEEAQSFRRAFSAEVAKLQTNKDTVKMLPNLEAMGGGEIARRIKAYGPGPGGVALGLLSEGAIMGVVPKLSSNDLVAYLGSMMNIPSIRQSELDKLDKGDMADGADPVVEIDSARKVASAMAALPAASEYATFNQLMKARGERLIAEIAPYRLMPYHLYYLSPEIIGEATQSRELDDLKKILMAVPQDLREKLLSMMTERQRAVAEDGGESSEHDADALRSFLGDLHSKNFAGQPHRVAEVFGTRKVA